MKGVLVDDREDQIQYAQALTDKALGIDSIDFWQPEHEAADLAERLINGNYDFAALDFRLDEVPIQDNKKQRNKYRASALAQQIRDRIIEAGQKDLPLILLSQEDFIKNIFCADTTAQDLFDLVLTKQELVSRDSLTLAIIKISSLADAYQGIKCQLKEHGSISLKNLLNLTEENEIELVISHQALRAIEKYKFAHQIVPKIAKLLIDRPGVLLSDVHMLARLGVAHNSPDMEKLQHILPENMKYFGLLNKGWPRWWWHRVESWFENTFQNSLEALSSEERVNLLNSHFGLQLLPAMSRWNGATNEYSWVACSCCNYPTELRHSVLKYEPSYKPFLEPLRICWYCVQTGADEEKELEVDDSDSGVAAKIKSGKILPKAQQ